MAEGKIEVKLGEFSFVGEGEQNWLATQLDKILKKAEDLSKLSAIVSTTPIGGNTGNGSGGGGNFSTTLASYLKEKGATTNQNKRFLATAEWLHLKGNKRLTTSDVTKALKDNNQSRLGNASESLNQNVGKGFCEKDGNQFFVTDEGRNSL